MRDHVITVYKIYESADTIYRKQERVYICEHTSIQHTESSLHCIYNIRVYKE